MTIELRMPAMSPTMEKATLAKWLVTEGDLVREGDALAEIETDKATMELEAIDDGRIATLLVQNGTEDVRVGTILALLTDADDDAVAEPTVGIPAEEKLAAAPVATAPATTKPTAHASIEAPGARPAPRTSADQVQISPLARRIAEANGLDLTTITGTGPNGRIVRADLGLDRKTRSIQAPAPLDAAVVPIAAQVPLPPEGVPVVSERLSGMRRTIASRLTASKQHVPHFYLTVRCNLDPLLKLRAHLNAELVSQGIKLSVNDMLIKALAHGLQAVPEANVQFGGDVLHRFGRVDVAMAVAIEGGLVTPVLKDAGSLSLSAISRQSKALADKARSGKLLPEDYVGGTVSLSNLGMFGVDEMTPVINPPQALILGTAAGMRQPWNVDSEIALATVMAATAAFDHRAIDGAVGARFMAALREVVEQPLMLLA